MIYSKKETHVDEEALVQKIITTHSMYSLGWTGFTFCIFLVLQQIHIQLDSGLNFSLNLNHQLSSLLMFTYCFCLSCILLNANHKIFRSFKVNNISSVATINYKLVGRGVVFIIAIGLVLMCIFAIIDFMHPPF